MMGIVLHYFSEAQLLGSTISRKRNGPHWSGQFTESGIYCLASCKVSELSPRRRTHAGKTAVLTLKPVQQFVLRLRDLSEIGPGHRDQDTVGQTVFWNLLTRAE